MAQDFATFCRCRATNDKPSCYRTVVPLDMRVDAGTLHKVETEQVRCSLHQRDKE